MVTRSSNLFLSWENSPLLLLKILSLNLRICMPPDGKKHLFLKHLIFIHIDRKRHSFLYLTSFTYGETLIINHKPYTINITDYLPEEEKKSPRGPRGGRRPARAGSLSLILS